MSNEDIRKNQVLSGPAASAERQPGSLRGAEATSGSPLSMQVNEGSIPSGSAPLDGISNDPTLDGERL